jgi:hypothetical protein
MGGSRSDPADTKIPWHKGRIHGCHGLSLVDAGWLVEEGGGEEDAEAQKKVEVETRAR